VLHDLLWIYAWSCYCLAYFMAKKGEKKIYLSLIYACVFCIYFAELSVMPMVCLCLYYCCCIYFATVSGMCRCCLLCYNILVFFTMIWDFVLSIFILYMFLEHVWCSCRCWHLCYNISMMILGIYFSEHFYFLYLFPATILWNYWNLSAAVALVCCCWCCNIFWSESSQNLSIFSCTCSLPNVLYDVRTCLCVTLIGLPGSFLLSMHLEFMYYYPRYACIQGE